jgi:CRP-like cAMP-binding protein
MKNYLKAFNILSEREIDQILQVGVYKSLQKGEYFAKEGSICKEVAFVISGIFRSFYHSSDQNEITYCFTFPNSFIAAYSSFISQEKTVENIQALTPIELFSIPKYEIDKLEKSSSNWLLFFKIMAEQEYLKLEKRIFILQNERAEKKYQHLLENHPDYLQQIPLGYLASYLGITQRHLSRIRK